MLDVMRTIAGVAARHKISPRYEKDTLQLNFVSAVRQGRGWSKSFRVASCPFLLFLNVTLSFCRADRGCRVSLNQSEVVVSSRGSRLWIIRPPPAQGRTFVDVTRCAALEGALDSEYVGRSLKGNVPMLSTAAFCRPRPNTPVLR